MTKKQFVVVEGERDGSQFATEVVLLNPDGTPWSPGGGGDVSVTWADVSGKPATFTPSEHTHDIADVTGLQDELDGKASKVNQGQASMLENGTDTAGRPWAAKDIADYVNAQIAAAIGAGE